MTETLIWKGKSGKEYKYWIYGLDGTHDPVPANYIFAKKLGGAYYTPIHIGETEDISERFDNHPKMPCIRRNGATHFCTHKGDDDKTVRRAEEADLVNNYNPPCDDEQ